MGLVDYSDSDSDSEVVQKPAAPAPSTAATGKKPFQKLVDRGSGKIVVNLSGNSADAPTNTSDEPPAKRARTAGSGASRFSNFGSFLPPPKKTATVIGKSISASLSSSRSGGTAPAPGIHLKTGAEPAFSRAAADITEESTDGAGYGNQSSGSGLGLNLPPPKKSASGPTIPEGQKPAEEVKLVGKPLMFKPLSVARRAGQQQKKKNATTAVPKSVPSSNVAVTAPTAQPPAPPPKKKISLFSMGGDDETGSSSSSGAAATTTGTNASNGTYEPLFTGAAEATNSEEYNYTDSNSYDTYDTYNQNQYQPPPVQQHHQPQQQNELTSIADSLSLSKAARRELFGRNGPPAMSSSSTNIINFNMEKEYEHNEALRQSGALADQVHNPVRSIAPGKHSLRQMVNMAQNNQAALEDSFAAGKNNRRDAAGKYGWK